VSSPGATFDNGGTGWHTFWMAAGPFALPEGGRAAGEQDLVKLDPDHPGFRDQVYLARRNSIARVALEYQVGQPVPRIEYGEDEHAVWRTVWRKLTPLHDRYACREYLDSRNRLALDRVHIPQLADVNRRLEPLTGFSMIPVAGLVSSRVFLSNLGQRKFLSTQYIRHPSRPLYTPEPDVVHELVGHACTLCHPTLAGLNRMFGEAASHVSDDALAELERVYWYTMEFGLVVEDGSPRAYGAGLLSSSGELERFAASAAVRPFDPEEAARSPYDPTTYQAVLYRVPDFVTLTSDVRAWLATRGA
jgi:phenylalanine-4-hydroxylase